MKTISYFGRRYLVPNYAQAVATEKSGRVYVYEVMYRTEDEEWNVGFALFPKIDCIDECNEESARVWRTSLRFIGPVCEEIGE